MYMFTHSLRYPSRKAPFMERGQTQETEWPWRKGKSLVIRLPFSTSARAFGVWTGVGTEDDFHAAVGTRAAEIPSEEIRTW